MTASDLAKIKQAFQRDEVAKLIDLKTIHLSPEEVLVAGKIDVLAKYEPIAYDIVNTIGKSIRQGLPDKKMYIYIEVDEYDADYSQKKSHQSSK